MFFARRVGRQWMLTALAEFGDTDGGTSVELADRLALHGIDVEPPPEPGVFDVPSPDKPYPREPTEGWLRQTLRAFGERADDKSRDTLITRARALGFTELR